MDKKLLKLLLLAMLVGVVFVELIFGNGLGLLATFGVFLIIITLIVTSRDVNKFNIKRGFFLFLSLISLGVSYTYHDNELFLFLNCFLIIAIGTIYTIQMVEFKKFALDSRWFTNLLKHIFYPIGEFDIPVKLISKSVRIKKVRELSNKTKGILIGIIISLPLLLIMISLLASADQVFKSFVTIDMKFLDKIFEIINLPKLLIGLFITFYIFSYFHFALYKDKTDNKIEDTNIASKEKLDQELKEVIIQTLLILINILFLFFTFIQFKYLFSSSIGNISKVITYSSYARRGFFELTLISLINIGLIVLLTNHSFKQISKFLMTLLIFNTLVIAYSALFRMNLYILAYGYTWLRVMSSGFIVLQGLLLLIVLYHVWRRSFDIKLVILTVYLLAYITVNFVNIDSMIVKGNVNRYLDGSRLDVQYFYELSYSSVSTLKYYEDFFSDDPEHENAKELIENVLDDKKNQLTNSKKKWFNFNIAEYKARRLLE